MRSSTASVSVPVEARHSSEYPSLDEQMAAIHSRRGLDTWRTASVDEALGSPAIFGGVALITNTIATLSMEAYRNGVRLTDDVPRLVQRPQPGVTLRAFLQRLSFHIATRGEGWLWVAKRDPLDNSPMSVYPVPPWEIVVTVNDADRLRPEIKWGDRIMPNEDMKQIQYLPGRDGRGFGPLQKCGAAHQCRRRVRAMGRQLLLGVVAVASSAPPSRT